MGPRKFHQSASELLKSEGFDVHFSTRLGLLIKAPENKIHRVELGTYPVHSTKGPFLPRLDVNPGTYPHFVPAKVVRNWLGNTRSESIIFRRLGLEITFTDDEAESIVSGLPRLLKEVEAGGRDFEAAFSFLFENTTPTNLWTSSARAIANASYVPNKVFDR